MKYIVTINNNNYEVEVEQGEARLVKTTETAAVPVTAKAVAAPEVQAAPVAASAPAPQPAAAAGGNTINSPMPGTILDVRKQAGDSVKKGETVFILEAMKMENEILASADCVIAQISTAKGASVSTGDILAVLR